MDEKAEEMRLRFKKPPADPEEVDEQQHYGKEGMARGYQVRSSRLCEEEKDRVD